jgi:hypothetical protein
MLRMHSQRRALQAPCMNPAAFTLTNVEKQPSISQLTSAKRRHDSLFCVTQRIETSAYTIQPTRH